MPVASPGRAVGSERIGPNGCFRKLRGKLRLLSAQSLLVARVLPLASHCAGVRRTSRVRAAWFVAAEQQRLVSRELLDHAWSHRSFGIQGHLSRRGPAGARM